MKIQASYSGTDPNDTKSVLFINVSAIVEAPNGFIIVNKDQERDFLYKTLCDKGIEIELEEE